MKKDKVTVEAWVHWKQGDDFNHFLEEYSTPKALEMWGKSLIDSGKQLLKASEILSGCDIEAQGGTHHVSLSEVDRTLAEQLYKLGIFYQDHLEKEHEDCTDEYCVFCHDLDELLIPDEEDQEQCPTCYISLLSVEGCFLCSQCGYAKG